MPTPFPLEIVTLGHAVFQGTVERLSLRGGDGSLAIEARHAPMVTSVSACSALLRGAEGEGDFHLAVSDGFLLVTATGASLLVETAERAAQIDVSRAQGARQRAEDRLAGADPDLDQARARAALARATTRLSVAEDR